MQNLPRYHEIHVISDIHMGGETGFQVLRETERLGKYIDWVAGQCPNGDIALILNGDVIDTLAEDSFAGYIAMEHATDVVARIMGDAAFKPIWEALRRFVENPRRNLVFVLGNHDLEVALPAVQRHITDYLATNDSLARARIEFSTIGAGHACLVGNAQHSAHVFCTHGNEVDPFNYVQYEALSRLARRLNDERGLKDDEWQPNAGTKLVRDVMNDVKRKYRWVDLLKPEVEVVLPLLGILDPASLKRFPAIVALKAVSEWRRRTDMDGRLGATPAAPAAASARPDAFIGQSRRRASDKARIADDMLLEIEKSLARGEDFDYASTDQTLGVVQFIIDRLTGSDECEALRKALKDWVVSDLGFDSDNQDDTFKDIVKSVAASIDVIVTGHTHLHRSIPLAHGRHYFNTGTWIRLIGFIGPLYERLNSKDRFADIYDVLKQGTIEAIDAARIDGQSLVLDRCSAVRIRLDQDKVRGELLEIKNEGAIATTVVGPVFTKE